MSESDKVWKAFQRELAVLEEKILEYEEKDMAQFEVKVHGIKGAAKQLGELELSSYAELMERAAKEQDKEYLHAHVSEFVKQITASRLRAEEKLKAIKPKQEKKKLKQKNSAELFQGIKQGFDLYNIDMVEDRLVQLERLTLTAQEQHLAEQLREACDNLEYEAGSELLKNFCKE